MNMNPGNLRVFIKVDKRGNVVVGSMIRRKKQPKTGNWIEIDGNVCCTTTEEPVTTTTTVAP